MASKDRADANAIFIKRIIFAIDFLQHLRPRNDQRDTQNIFDVGSSVPDISPSVKSVGITGQITGSRADVLISNDVEVPNNSGTQMQSDKLSESVREYDAIIKPGGTIIYLGTPQNEMSIYNELQNRGYECVIYPEDDASRKFYGDRLAKYIADEELFEMDKRDIKNGDSREMRAILSQIDGWQSCGKNRKYYRNYGQQQYYERVG